MNDLTEALELLNKRTFWTSFVGEVYAFSKLEDTSLDINSVDFQDAELAFDKVVDFENNKYAYLNIMNDTTSSLYKVQFVFMKSKSHSRRKILSALNDIVKSIIIKYIKEDGVKLGNQAQLMEDFTKNPQDAYIDDNFTVKYIVNLVYTKLLEELYITKSKKESTVMYGIQVYILCAVIIVLRSLNKLSKKYHDDYYSDWIRTFEV